MSEIDPPPAPAAPSAQGEGRRPDFPFSHPVAVRFRDLDPMGHAHHSLPLVYFEEARAAFWRMLTGEDGLEAIDYVIGGVRVAYRERVRFPMTATVELRVSRIGDRSFTFEYELRGPEGQVLVEGSTDQVLYDYPAGRSKPIPEALRAALEAAAGG